ncbi:hypothetical protein V1503_19195 [Bacillus sp. SCS-151]|uniref:hypothetical protein n=1 Tax=Nanhaiella sioensis TaxID=3115293 RepID=UPI00397B9FA3
MSVVSMRKYIMEKEYQQSVKYMSLDLALDPSYFTFNPTRTPKQIARDMTIGYMKLLSYNQKG